MDEFVFLQCYSSQAILSAVAVNKMLLLWCCTLYTNRK